MYGTLIPDHVQKWDEVGLQCSARHLPGNVNAHQETAVGCSQMSRTWAAPNVLSKDSPD